MLLRGMGTQVQPLEESSARDFPAGCRESRRGVHQGVHASGTYLPYNLARDLSELCRPVCGEVFQVSRTFYTEVLRVEFWRAPLEPIWRIEGRLDDRIAEGWLSFFF